MGMRERKVDVGSEGLKGDWGFVNALVIAGVDLVGVLDGFEGRQKGVKDRFMVVNAWI